MSANKNGNGNVKISPAWVATIVTIAGWLLAAGAIYERSNNAQAQLQAQLAGVQAQVQTQLTGVQAQIATLQAQGNRLEARIDDLYRITQNGRVP